MGARHDLEELCADVEACMRANLNTQLAIINSEKDDGITLKPVSDGAYFFEYWQERIANFNPAILYGIEDLSNPEPVPSLMVMQIKLSISLLLSDDGLDSNIMKRLLRYQRGLIEVFERNWNAVSRSVKFAVSGTTPFPIVLENRSYPDRIIGITLEGTLA